MTDLNDAVARAMGWRLLVEDGVVEYNWWLDEAHEIDGIYRTVACSDWQPDTSGLHSWIVEGWLLDTIGAVTLVKLGGVYSVIWDDADMAHHEIHNENRLVAICEAAVEAGKNE